MAEVIPHYLFFTVHSDEKAYLYFGSSLYLLPAAELSSRVNAGMMDDSEEISLSKRRSNPARVADSLNQYHFTLLKLGAGVLALLATLVVVRMIRNWLF